MKSFKKWDMTTFSDIFIAEYDKGNINVVTY